MTPVLPSGAARWLPSALTALVLALAVTVAAAGLTACGQKGQLYLPPPKKSKVPQSTPQTPSPQQPPATPSPTSTAPAPS
jgi:predicted small lipoprotein YifL